MKKTIFLTTLILVSLSGFGQKADKDIRYFDTPIVADSLSTLMIPVRYNANLFSSNKFAYWNDYYANILFYNFNTKTSKKLFAEDTLIKNFTSNFNKLYFDRNKKEFTSNKWIFYFVKPIDYDKNGRINEDDPTILYVSDKQGNELKSITPENESVVSMDLFEKQGFILVKMQRDLNKNNKFESNDKDYYYIRLDINTLKTEDKIEVNQ